MVVLINQGQEVEHRVHGGHEFDIGGNQDFPERRIKWSTRYLQYCVAEGVRVRRFVRNMQVDTKTVIILSPDNHIGLVIETEHVLPSFFIVIIPGYLIVLHDVIDEEPTPRLRCLPSEAFLS